MDRIDEQILAELSRNGRATASEIGGRVSLSVPATAERIRKLRLAGVIEGYTVRVSRSKTQYRLLAFVTVRLERSGSISDFREGVLRLGAVLECHHITGQHDYLLKVQVEDTDALEDFLSHGLKAIAGVAETNTMVVLSTLAEKANRF